MCARIQKKKKPHGGAIASATCNSALDAAPRTRATRALWLCRCIVTGSGVSCRGTSATTTTTTSTICHCEFGKGLGRKFRDTPTRSSRW